MHVDCGTLVDGDGRVLEDARFRIEDGRDVETVYRAGERVAGDR